jgi:Helix-turn-helix domain/Putative transposase DNA-binding domain
LNRTFGCVRLVWNKALAWRQARQSATYTRPAFTRPAFRRREGRLYLARMMDAPLEVVWSWPNVDPASIEPTSVTVSREPCGRWCVSLAVQIADPEPAPSTGAVARVDLGVKDFAVTSDGDELSLSTRAWRCPSCRTLHDRDVNTAKNILAAGRAVTACGGDIEHPGTSRMRSPAKQEPQPARAGTSALQGEE